MRVKLTLRDRQPDASAHGDSSGPDSKKAHKSGRVASATRFTLRNSNSSMSVSRPTNAAAKSNPRAGIEPRSNDSRAGPVISVSIERSTTEREKLIQQLQESVEILQQATKGKVVAEHNVRSAGLHYKKRKFEEIAECTKIGAIAADLADDRINSYFKMIDEMLQVHEGAFKPCDETTYQGFLAIFGLSAKLIRDKDDGNIARAMFHSKLEELEEDVARSHVHKARMQRESRTLAQLLSCPEAMSDMSDDEMSRVSTLPGKSRSPSPMSPRRNRNQNMATQAGTRRPGPIFDPRPRTAASASRGQQSIQNHPPSKVTDMEDMFSSDTDSACSLCSQRGKCPAQDGVCDGPKVEEVD